MLLLIQSFQLSCYKFTKDLTFAFFFSADANLLTTWSALNSSFSVSDFSRFLTFNFVFSISLSILVSEMVCFAFLQFLSCLFSGNSLIHSLCIDLHRYILHYCCLRYSHLHYIFCLSSCWSSSKAASTPLSFAKERFDFVLRTFTNGNSQLS